MREQKKKEELSLKSKNKAINKRIIERKCKFVLKNFFVLKKQKSYNFDLILNLLHKKTQKFIAFKK
jgi:hypothetical protein